MSNILITSLLDNVGILEGEGSCQSPLGFTMIRCKSKELDHRSLFKLTKKLSSQIFRCEINFPVPCMAITSFRACLY